MMKTRTIAQLFVTEPSHYSHSTTQPTAIGYTKINTAGSDRCLKQVKRIILLLMQIWAIRAYVIASENALNFISTQMTFES